MGQLRHRVETIWLAHSLYRILPPMTASARQFETILVWASQAIVNGPTKSRVLARCANSLGHIKYRINTHFFVQTQRKRETLLGQYCTNNGVFAGYLENDLLGFAGLTSVKYPYYIVTCKWFCLLAKVAVIINITLTYFWGSLVWLKIDFLSD